MPVCSPSTEERPPHSETVQRGTTNTPDMPNGAPLLPVDLTAEQLAAAPVLESVDDLIIDELTDEEYDAFVAALEQ